MSPPDGMSVALVNMPEGAYSLPPQADWEQLPARTAANKQRLLHTDLLSPPVCGQVNGSDEGEACTAGDSFRSRVQAQQRSFRDIPSGHGEHAHWLRQEDAEQGTNFDGAAQAEVMARAAGGKGVTRPGPSEHALQPGDVLQHLRQSANSRRHGHRDQGPGNFLPTIQAVKQIHLEYTPVQRSVRRPERPRRRRLRRADRIRNDARAEAACSPSRPSSWRRSSAPAVSAGSRQARHGPRTYCREGTSRQDFSGCLYASKKGYRYWHRSLSLGTLKPDVLRDGDSALRRRAVAALGEPHARTCRGRERWSQEATFAVCAPKRKYALLKGGALLRTFASLLSCPASFAFMPLEDLVQSLEASIEPTSCWKDWTCYLRRRYVVQ